MNAFDKLSNQLRKSIEKQGITTPTEIQNLSIPHVIQGKDLIGESATGSGKTIAFGCGVVQQVVPKQGIQSLILTPTRELAEQVKEALKRLSNLRITAIYGGVAISPQIDALKQAEVVVATPGRTLDHLNRRTIDTSKVKLLVLDEADRMVEMGFIDDVGKIIKSCPKKRQTLLFSATMSGPAKQIAKRYMKNPTTVHATKMVDPSKLKQTYYDVPPKLKKELLVHLLKKEKSDLVMVFCNTRRATDLVVDVLKANGVKATPIHGGLNQAKRLKTIDLFHKGKFHVLVCTDVAARGLHIEGVTHIYNFDIPKEPGDYVHRIGRTARAGKKGLVINILANRDYDNFSRLKTTHRDFKIQKEKKPYLKCDLKEVKRSPRKFGDSKKGFRGRSSGGFRKGSRNSSSRNSRSRSQGNHRRRYNN